MENNTSNTDEQRPLNKHGVMQGLPDDNMANLYNELSGRPAVAKSRLCRHDWLHIGRNMYQCQKCFEIEFE